MLSLLFWCVFICALNISFLYFQPFRYTMWIDNVLYGICGYMYHIFSYRWLIKSTLVNMIWWMVHIFFEIFFSPERVFSAQFSCFLHRYAFSVLRDGKMLHQMMSDFIIANMISHKEFFLFTVFFLSPLLNARKVVF